MRLIIPSTVDINELIQNAPDGLKRDYLVLFLYLIYRRQMVTKKGEGANPFVALNSTILQSYHSKYRHYFAYLENLGIVQIKSYYEKNKTSKKFRFTPDHFAKGVLVEITDFCLKRKLNKKKQSVLIKEKQHIQKWYNPGLIVDEERAIQIIDIKFEEDAKVDLNKAVKSYNNSLMAIQMIDECDFPFSIDKNSGRVYGLVTHTPKILRSCLEYHNGVVKNGQFVEIDIANSQPLFLLSLLNPEMYKGWTSDSTEVPLFSSSMSSDIPRFTSNTNFEQPKLISSISSIQDYYSVDITLMLLKMTQRIDSERFNEVKQSVLKGGFYLWVKEQFENIGYPEKDIKYYKNLTLKSLFMNPKLILNRRFFKNKKYEECQIFWSLNPELQSLVSIFKHGDHKRFANMLQSMESYVMIEQVSRILSERHPKMPFYNIHDGILVLKGYEEEVVQIVRDECFKVIGYHPTVRIKE